MIPLDYAICYFKYPTWCYSEVPFYQSFRIHQFFYFEMFHLINVVQLFMWPESKQRPITTSHWIFSCLFFYRKYPIPYHYLSLSLLLLSIIWNTASSYAYSIIPQYWMLNWYDYGSLYYNCSFNNQSIINQVSTFHLLRLIDSGIESSFRSF